MFNSDTFSLFVVEENPDEIALFQIISKRYFPKWKITFGQNLAELTSCMARSPYVSLVLVNIDLTNQKSRKLLTEIKEVKNYIGLPVVGYTSALTPFTIKTLLENGVDHFFEKPYGLEQLLEQFRQLPSLSASGH